MSDPCERRALIEKLADGELEDVGRKEAEAHVAACESCRSHLAFLLAIAESSRGVALPEPPASYWDHLPRKILARLDSEEMASPSGGFWQRLLSPDAIKWEALLATLVVVVVVGATVLRNDLLAPPSEPLASSAPAETERRIAPPEQATPPAAPEAFALPAPVSEAPPPEPKAPSVARDEALREDEAARGDVLTPEAEEELQSLGYVAGGAPSPAAPTPAAVPAPSTAQEPVGAAPERAKSTAETRSAVLRRHALLAREAAPATDCDLLRERVSAAAESSADVWYELARCSMRQFEADPSPELRELAVSDAEAFLKKESEGPRAEEIRHALERLQSARPR